MDKIIYDENMDKTMKMWLSMAEYTEIDFAPFEEIEINFCNIKDHNTTVIYKQNRIVYKLDSQKQTTKIELKDGKFVPTKVTYSDFGDMEDTVANSSIDIINGIFSFVCNYNLPQNEKFRTTYTMWKIIKGDIPMSKNSNKKVSSTNLSNDKNDKIHRSYSSVADLVRIARPVKHSENSETREYTRHSEGWTVKGYMRKKPKGGYTWVHPHTRGDKHNKKDKNYRI